MIEATAISDRDGPAFGAARAGARANRPVCNRLSRSDDRMIGVAGEGRA